MLANARRVYYGRDMSLTVKIILIVALVLIGSHLLLWGFIKRKLRDAEARIAKEKANGDGGGVVAPADTADCGTGDSGCGGGGGGD